MTANKVLVKIPIKSQVVKKFVAIFLKNLMDVFSFDVTDDVLPTRLTNGYYFYLFIFFVTNVK